ncbi:MAG TPA: FkbM family methyltransferase [Longimicrobium sp.]|nr:FkbM family methyltransferase [Longimicrobium sp.]
MAEPARPQVAGSSAYREPTALERLGAAAGRLLPQGALRRGLRAVYRLAVRLRTGGSVTARLPGGEAVKLLPEYRFVTWNPAEYEAFRAAAAPGAVALDVGANVGAYTLLLGGWVRPGGRVFAFEPAPEAFGGLARHVALNGLGDVVTPVRAAAAASTGTATLAGDGLSGANRLDASAAGERVETVTIDDFCRRENVVPTFIKIDVEGAELDVLRGARETISRGGEGLAVFVEMHPTLWSEMGITAADLRAELETQGLRAVPLRVGVADPWTLEGECLRLVRT